MVTGLAVENREREKQTDNSCHHVACSVTMQLPRQSNASIIPGVNHNSFERNSSTFFEIHIYIYYYSESEMRRMVNI